MASFASKLGVRTAPLKSGRERRVLKCIVDKRTPFAGVPAYPVRVLQLESPIGIRCDGPTLVIAIEE
jgi:hypothetical protein